MKISIIYFSQTGRTRQMAEQIAQGIQAVDAGLEVGLFELDKVDPEFVNASRAVVFGTPTHLANMAWPMKKWLDESMKTGCHLGGKLGAVFATADYVQGGADTAITTIINHLLVLGMLVYSGGASLGKPFIHLGPVALKDNLEDARELFEIFGHRLARKVLDLF